MRAEHPATPAGWWPGLRILQFFLDSVLLIQALSSFTRVQAARNISIPNVASQVVYTPFLCDGTQMGSCGGAWQIIDVEGVRVVSTDGPSGESGDILPQMFIRFRASALFLTTSSESRALANFTISAGAMSVSAQINTTVPTVGAINLIESETTQLAITYVSSGRLDIGLINITVSDDNASLSTLLPTPTLPSPNPPPTFTVPPVTTTSDVPEPNPRGNNTFVAQAVGLTVGLGLGLTALAILAFLCYRLCSRRRRRNVHFETETPNPVPTNTSHPESVGKAY